MAIAKALNNPATKSPLHRRLTKVRLQDLSVPCGSIASVQILSNIPMANYPNIRMGAFLGMIWSFSRIYVPSGSGRQRYSVLGAVQARYHDLVSIKTAGSIHAAVVSALSVKISATYTGEEITLVRDNAPCQRSRLVIQISDALDMEFICHPAYYPNLNLIERVWCLVKTRCFVNNYFKDFTLISLAMNPLFESPNSPNRENFKQ